MKKYILYIAGLMCCMPACTQNITVSLDAIDTKNNIAYLHGTITPFTDKAVAHFPNGNPSIEMNYVNGKETGWNKQWYANGNLKNETEMLEGKINGKWIDYYGNGQKEADITYENDYMNRPCICYYPNG